MAKAVGVGGVFLKASAPQKLSDWYAQHLGIPSQEGGSLAFDGPESTGMTVFAHFPESTKYFGDGPQEAMINFRVDNLDELLGQLAAAKVRIDPNREDYSYGRFAWIWDPEGNRVELWEPQHADSASVN
jgi:predicted enzyme related to lactoylglutathione lyase